MAKEELTTKMHSEFNISDKASIRLTAFMALSDMKEFNYSITDASELYAIPESEILNYKDEHEALLVS
jgi:hypothetical protein